MQEKSSFWSDIVFLLMTGAYSWLLVKGGFNYAAVWNDFARFLMGNYFPLGTSIVGPPEKFIRAVLGAIWGILPLSILGGLINLITQVDLHPELKETLNSNDRGNVFLKFLLSGLLEEAVFRYFPLVYLPQRWGLSGFETAALMWLASIIFGLLHRNHFRGEKSGILNVLPHIGSGFLIAYVFSVFGDWRVGFVAAYLLHVTANVLHMVGYWLQNGKNP